MTRNTDPEDEFHDRKAEEYENPVDFEKKAREKEEWAEDYYGW